MDRMNRSPRRSGSLLLLLLLPLTPTIALCSLDLGPQELVQASGSAVTVPGYSVPSFTCWNGDSLPDLLVGEGSGTYPDAKVRVYLNLGTAEEPLFEGWSYVQSEGSDLVSPGGG